MVFEMSPEEGECPEYEDEAGKDEDFVDEPVGPPDGPLRVRSAEEEVEKRDNDDDLNGGHRDCEKFCVWLPSQEGPCKPDMSYRPEVPKDMGCQWKAVGDGIGDGEDIFDDQSPSGKNEQEVGEKGDPAAGCGSR